MTREAALNDAEAPGTAAAVAAGARSDTIEIVGVGDVPLTHLPGNATRARVKALGVSTQTLEADSGTPAPTDALKYGQRLIAMAWSCDPACSSLGGIELIGPRYVKHDHDHVPLQAHG